VTTTEHTRRPRLKRARRLAIGLVLSAAAAFATVGGAGAALDYPPGPYATDLPPGPGAAADLPPGPNAAAFPPGPYAADLPPGPTAAAFPPGPGAIGPEI
jgi:hypothetical protein